MNAQAPDLYESGALAPEENVGGLPAGPTDPELEALVNSTAEGINGSLAAMHISLRVLATRVNTLERMVSYLLEKDPEMGPKMRAQADSLAAEASVQAAAESPLDGQS